MDSFGIVPADRKAAIWDDGNYKFSTSTRATIGKAVARVLKKPVETANRSVFISSFEVNMNQILHAVKMATEQSYWTVEHVTTDEMLAKGKEEWATHSIPGILKLALGIQLRPDCENNFKEFGKLDNELLNLEPEDVNAVVAQALKDKPKEG